MAILAEVVQLRAAGTLARRIGSTVRGRRRHEEIDPVCGMTVDMADGALT